MSHIWMSHDTHMNESCHTYEWVMDLSVSIPVENDKHQKWHVSKINVKDVGGNAKGIWHSDGCVYTYIFNIYEYMYVHIHSYMYVYPYLSTYVYMNVLTCTLIRIHKSHGQKALQKRTVTLMNVVLHLLTNVYLKIIAMLSHGDECIFTGHSKKCIFTHLAHESRDGCVFTYLTNSTYMWKSTYQKTKNCWERQCERKQVQEWMCR